MTNRKAFTLIELLVVIAIIALLLSILMPSLALVKRKARGVVCQSNMKQMTAAWFVYSGDHNDGMVGGNTHSPSPLYRNKTWNYSWVTPPQEEDGTEIIAADEVTLENETRGIERGMLFPYIGEVKLYHCTGAKDKKFRGGYRSYSITGLMNGEQARDWDYPEHAVSKKTHIKEPHEKIVFLENTDFDRGWNMGSWIFWTLDLKQRWGDPLAVWHGDSSSMGYADGHAEVHRWECDSTIDMIDTGGGIDPMNEDGCMTDLDYMWKAYFPKSYPKN